MVYYLFINFVEFHGKLYFLNGLKRKFNLSDSIIYILWNEFIFKSEFNLTFGRIVALDFSLAESFKW